MNFSKINIETILKNAEKHQINNDRSHYTPYLQTIEQNAINNNLLIGGDIAISNILNIEQNISHWSFEIYGDNIFEVAKKTADDMILIQSKFINSEYVELQTNLKHKELTLYINAIPAAKYFALPKYFGKSLYKIIERETYKTEGYFGNKIKTLPIDTLIIDIYRKLYSLNQHNNLEKNLKYEDELYNLSKKTRNNLFDSNKYNKFKEGGNMEGENQLDDFDNNYDHSDGYLSADILTDYQYILTKNGMDENIDEIYKMDEIDENSSDKSDISDISDENMDDDLVNIIQQNVFLFDSLEDKILGGDELKMKKNFELPSKKDFNKILLENIKNENYVFIGDVARILHLSDHFKLEKDLSNIKIQFLTEKTPEELLTWLEIIFGIEFKNRFTYKIYDVGIPSDFLIKKYIFYYENSALFDAYNSLTYETLSIHEQMNYIYANILTVIRFRFIEVWILKILFMNNEENAEKYKNIIVRIYDDIDLLRAKFKQTKLNDIFPIMYDAYRGKNIIEKVIKNKMIAEQQFIPSYFPAKKILVDQ